MVTDIFFHLYELHARSGPALSAKSVRPAASGALLRIGDGFACLNPWPELGDAALEAQLESLRDARVTPLVARALRCAGIDAVARRKGKSVFEGLAIPESHALLPLDADGDGDAVAEALTEGFLRIKIKCGTDPGRALKRLRDVADALDRAGDNRILLRLDFNETLTQEGFLMFCQGAGDDLTARIEFVEDPFPYDPEAWEQVTREVGVALAVDRDVARAGAKEGAGARFAVIKPAIDDADAIAGRAAATGQRLVFTTYLDHPVGQMFAAFEAARIAAERPVEICGLLSHRVFEKNAFSEQIICRGSSLSAPEGTGLGFDERLESLPWKRLT